MVNNMDDLIRLSRKAANEWKNSDTYYQASVLIDSLCDYIEHSVPQAHAKWVKEPYQTLIPVEYDKDGEPILHDHIAYRCSICGRKEGTKEPYCNCGARMDEVEE